MDSRKILHKCVDCGKERLVRVRNGKPVNTRCQSCAHKISGTKRKWYNEICALGLPVKTGDELGYKVKGYYVYHPCEICGDKRWKRFVNGRIVSTICTHCRAKKHRMSGSPKWKGGRRKLNRKYFEVLLPFDSPYLEMAGKSRNILEHRLVMAQSLGRCLQSYEIVHHKNGIKDDNRIENLELHPAERHKQIHLLQERIKELELENQLLRRERI